MQIQTDEYIELIKSYPALYDTKNPDYKNMEKKLKCWELVATHVGLPIEACKRKWKNLRDSYTKYLRSFRIGTKTSKKYHYWAHAEQMDFLRPFQGAIRTANTLDDSNELQNYLVNNSNEIIKNEPYMDEPSIDTDAQGINTTSNMSISDNFTNNFVDTNALVNESSVSPIQTPASSNSQIMNKMNITSSSYKSNSKSASFLNYKNNMKNLSNPNIKNNLSYSPSQVNSKHSKFIKNKIGLKTFRPPSLQAIKLISDLDANSMFFLSLAKSVSVMPTRYQSQIKTECMNIVNNAELEIENMNDCDFDDEICQYGTDGQNDNIDNNAEEFLYVMSPKTLIDISSDEDNM